MKLSELASYSLGPGPCLSEIIEFSEDVTLVSWNQFWHGYWTSCRLPEDNVFARMAVPSGWKKELVLRCLGRAIYFVYPIGLNPVFREADRIL